MDVLAAAAAAPAPDLAALEAAIAAEIERRRRQVAWAEVQRLFAEGAKEASWEKFCRELVVITTKDADGTTAPFCWSEIQRRFNAGRTGRDIVLKARQIGLTTNELARDAWFAMLRPNVCVAVVVQPHKEAEPKKKIVAQLTFILDHLGIDVGARWSGSKVSFANGSSITIFDSGGTEATADKQGRGGTFHRVHLTESAFYPFADAIIGSLLNALPPPEKGGELVDESTPNGARGRFYHQVQAARAGTSGMTLHFFPWMLQPEYRTGEGDGPAEPDNPDERELVAAAHAVGVTLTAAQLRWWRRERVNKGPDRTLQEFPHDPARCFLLPGSCYFELAAVERLEKRARPHLPPELLPEALAALARRFHDDAAALRVWEPPEPGVEYLAVTDTAGGKKRGDFPATLVFRRDTGRHVATYRHKVPPSEYARRLAALARLYNTAEIAVERNNHGGTVLVVLTEQESYPKVWKDTAGDGDAGFWTGPHNRLAIIDALVDAVTRGTLDTADAVFCHEARTFVRLADGGIGAAPGAHDDVVMAAAIARRILTLPRDYVGAVADDWMDR